MTVPAVEARPQHRTDQVLAVTGVTKSYGDNLVLRGVDLAIRSGQVVGVVGPNGAGKSTLVSIVAGLAAADAGDVTILGRPVRPAPGTGPRTVGLASQETAVYPTLTVLENLTYLGRLYGHPRGARGRLVDAAAADLGLGRLLGRDARHLSGGERRRLHVAMALLSPGPLLVLDEPTAGVDIESRAHILAAVERRRAAGSAVLYCTHHLEELEDLGSQVVMLVDGAVIAEGPVDDIVAEAGVGALLLDFRDDAAATAAATAVAGALATGLRVTVPSPAPEREMVRVLDQLGGARASLVAATVARPSLHSAFIRLAGHAIDELDRSVPR